ncbi:metallophosphoesterase [Myxococcota bacterium]|nr:metallophosphoesterase [Myxococcota bacterium]
MDTHIVHLSDLHIGKNGDREINRLREIVARIPTMEPLANKRLVILVTGDVVDDGAKSQYKEAAELLRPLYEAGHHMLLVPGNHDYGFHGDYAQAKRFKYFKKAFYGVETISYPFTRIINGHYFIGLNSMKSETGFWDGLLADGELGSRQINDLKGILKSLEDRPPNSKIIVYLHHHPFLFPDLSVWEILEEKIFHHLKDGDDLMHNIKGSVDLLLFGHRHDHLDFSVTTLTHKFGIPHILASGATTTHCVEYAMNDSGYRDKEHVLDEGYMGRLIVIGENGDISHQNLNFPCNS